MDKQFTAPLQKGQNKGAWTYVVMPDSAEFFGFYSVFSKFASIWGPLLFALVNDITGSSRNAILSLIIFFALGFLLLSRVDIDEARRAKEPDPVHAAAVRQHAIERRREGSLQEVEEAIARAMSVAICRPRRSPAAVS